MKTQQWQLRKVPDPRTLADVESSREKPVLFWSTNGILTHGFDDETLGPMRLDLDGEVIRLHGFAKECSLYTQPSRPKTLEDVPDRRVILGTWTLDGKTESFLIFKVDSVCLDLNGDSGFKSYDNPKWQLTDCVVELVETEVGVMG